MNPQASQKFPKIFLRQLIPNLGSVIVMAAMLFANNARAAGLNAGASPSTISYQGTLSTVSGTALNTRIGLTFRLYNIQSSGTPLWIEAHTGADTVPVNNGLFNVLLGSITPIPSSVWDNPTVYLGVQVEGDSTELSPREVVSAVPYAMYASGTIELKPIIETKKLATQFQSNSSSPVIVSGLDTSILLTKPANVLVNLEYLVQRNANTDFYTIYIYRDNVVAFQSDAWITRTGVHAHENITFIDRDVPAGSHTYQVKILPRGTEIFVMVGYGSASTQLGLIAFP